MKADRFVSLVFIQLPVLSPGSVKKVISMHRARKEMWGSRGQSEEPAYIARPTDSSSK